jgi:hypothetical protein
MEMGSDVLPRRPVRGGSIDVTISILDLVEWLEYGWLPEYRVCKESTEGAGELLQQSWGSVVRGVWLSTLEGLEVHC